MKNRIARTDYPVTKIAEDTYMISDFGIANCYLLVGEEKALLIDCGLGIGDLKGAVRKITDKPIIVVCTHGHVDHASGDGQFDEIFVHEKDCGRNYRFQTSYTLRKLFLIASKGVVDKNITLKDLQKYKMRPTVTSIKDGHVFDLGGRNVKVRHLQGHTLGSITLIDDKSKIAFIGDNVSPSTWLFLPHASYVDEWLVSAREIRAFADEYSIYWGHEKGLLSKELIDTDIKYGEEILAKYKRNLPLFLIKFYPKNDRVNGSVVFRPGRVRHKRK